MPPAERRAGDSAVIDAAEMSDPAATMPGLPEVFIFMLLFCLLTLILPTARTPMLTTHSGFDFPPAAARAAAAAREHSSEASLAVERPPIADAYCALSACRLPAPIDVYHRLRLQSLRRAH